VFQYTTSVIGFSLLSLVQNTYSAFFFVTFKPWSERTKPKSSTGNQGAIKQYLGSLSEGIAFAFSATGNSGVGTSGGFTFMLETGRQRHPVSRAKREDISGGSAQTARARHLIPTFLPNVPQFSSRSIATKSQAGIDLTSVYQTLQTFMGGFS
jgi:HAE1 family hydrophobic/amphiphilic exporter-1